MTFDRDKVRYFNRFQVFKKKISYLLDSVRLAYRMGTVARNVKRMYTLF